MSEHQLIRQEILNLLTVLVDEGGMRYTDIDLPRKHIDAAVERILAPSAHLDKQIKELQLTVAAERAKLSQLRMLDATARIDELESIDGENVYYWDYRENQKTTTKVYLTIEERIAELQESIKQKEQL